MATMTVKGDRALIASIRKMAKGLATALAPVCGEAAQEAISSSGALVPTDTGGLKASAYVEPAHVLAGGTVAAASCGYSDPEAAFVHEGVFGKFKAASPSHFLRKGFKKARTKFRRSLLTTAKKFVESAVQK